MSSINNYNHEIDLPQDIAMQKFLWSDYFHDSVITDIGFERRFTGRTTTGSTLTLTVQCDRDCNRFYDTHENAAATLDDERFTYFLYFRGVEYFEQACDMSLMVYLNGRFKSTKTLRELSAESAYTYYHFRLQTVGGYMDIVFKGFKIRKKTGKVNYSLDGYDFTSPLSTISAKEKSQINEIIQAGADDWDCLSALEKLHAANDPDLAKYARLCMSSTNQELEDTKIYAAYLLSKIGDKSDLPAIEKLYFNTKDLLQKRHLQDAIELLHGKTADKNISIDTRIILNTFAGTKAPDDDTEQGENYWLLIEKDGTVIELDRVNNKALVLFDDSLDSLGLVNHNPIKNTLWISFSDITWL